MGFLDDLFGNTASDASQQAAGFQVNALNNAINQSGQFETRARGDLEPFAAAGRDALPGLQGLIQDPNQQRDFIENNPFFDSLADNAQQRLFNNQAARGKVGSGETAKALQNSILLLGNDLRSQSVGERQNLANTGLDAAKNQAFVTASAGKNINDLITGIGDAQAAGAVGSANAQGAGAAQGLQAGLGIGNLLTGGKGIKSLFSGDNTAQVLPGAAGLDPGTLQNLPSSIGNLLGLSGGGSAITAGAGTGAAGSSLGVGAGGLGAGTAPFVSAGDGGIGALAQGNAFNLSSVPNPFSNISGLFGGGGSAITAGAGSGAVGSSLGVGAGGLGAGTAPAISAAGSSVAGFAAAAATAIGVAGVTMVAKGIIGSLKSKKKQKALFAKVTEPLKTAAPVQINGETRFAFINPHTGGQLFASQLGRDQIVGGKRARAIMDVWNPQTQQFGMWHAQEGFVSGEEIAQRAVALQDDNADDRGDTRPSVLAAVLQAATSEEVATAQSEIAQLEARGETAPALAEAIFARQNYNNGLDQFGIERGN